MQECFTFQRDEVCRYVICYVTAYMIRLRYFRMSVLSKWLCGLGMAISGKEEAIMLLVM